jgi:hypothetical protein
VAAALRLAWVQGAQVGRQAWLAVRDAFNPIRRRKEQAMMENEAIAIELACETQHRYRHEQQALLAFALAVDIARAKRVVTNPEPVHPFLFCLVQSTYRSEGTEKVQPTTAQREKYEKAFERYEEVIA